MAAACAKLLPELRAGSGARDANFGGVWQGDQCVEGF